MQIQGAGLVFSPTDLSSFHSCRHLTGLEMAHARGTLERPFFNDPAREALAERGFEHEAAYVRSLTESGASMVDLREHRHRETAAGLTVDAMHRGVQVIVQGALMHGNWYGRPDILLRVEAPSRFGSWSYEVIDTKLARETRAGAVLQLVMYSELLDVIQTRRPRQFRIVTTHRTAPNQIYRLDDYAAYVRLVRSCFEQTITATEHDIITRHYPEPVDHCEVCAWSSRCAARRRSDDHPSLIANITRTHQAELEARDLRTLTQIAGVPLPLAFRPRRGSIQTLTRIREQARLQLHSRSTPVPMHELREVVSGTGLCRLPEPSPGDLFLDLEGDPFVDEGGREYLFGIAYPGDAGSVEYDAYWAFDEQEERIAFERVMDRIMEAWARYDGMHVYHYAAYEASAFKRLMGKYATREAQLDRLLRAEKFVDLYAVVRQSMFAGVERYSIKNLEPLYGFRREVDLAVARTNLKHVELAVEYGESVLLPAEVRDAVQGYNRDDCVSTHALREWLERVRKGAIESALDIPRPAGSAGAPPQDVDEREARVQRLRAHLLHEVPDDRLARTPEQEGRRLLAFLLDYHRRESKGTWWEFYRLRDLSDEDLLDESKAIAGLELVTRVDAGDVTRAGKPKGPVVDRYRYPPQSVEIGAGDKLNARDGTIGVLEQIDRQNCTVDIRKTRPKAELHPAAVFAFEFVSTDIIEDSLMRLGERVAAASTLDAFEDCVARELLLSRPPRTRNAVFQSRDRSDSLHFATLSCSMLDRGVLPVQGPPGSGKTHTGASMIMELVRQGKRVGVTANSHKVIRNLLDKVVTLLEQNGVRTSVAHRTDEDDTAPGPVLTMDSPRAALDALASGDVQVLGGTAWLWARLEFVNTVDTLFMDEAGQLALANAIATSQAATNVVLLGDPQQLEQPIRGSHPEGVGVSVLQHILGVSLTIPAERGIFLPVTWRLAPPICAFTSETFYESRLEPRSGLERQSLSGTRGLDGNGLWIAPVEHAGNRNSSDEEVSTVRTIIDRLLTPGATWADASGTKRPLQAEDILVVSPYNAQVSRLTERLAPHGVQVGTVDRFQGQEAPVSIYSMATSHPEDAPRGMEFLYSLNRLNVATSRARCATILVANASLFEPHCRTPRQMKLANALCRFRELARVVQTE